MAKKQTQKSKSDSAFGERMAKQRAKRGFCDRDVWNIDYWFCNTISPMLKQLAKTQVGFHQLDEKGNIISPSGNLTDEETEMYAKRWKDTILHLAFLADEMDEEKCSMKNPYYKEWSRVSRAFNKKYGTFGEKLRTEEDKNDKLHPLYFPEDDPINGAEYKKITDKYFQYEMKIERYREKCKNEFFRLFSKYFHYLWD
ncbi:MAG: hypothetical protein J6W13_14155 [Salinivirgaceae bacterium]|nr:hypothetical protein [Salinivirgaceae bacterium]